MNIKFFFLFLVTYWACFNAATAQIDSTKTHLYLQCANEILINYPENIDTTKITFEVKEGNIYQILSKKKILVVPSSSTLIFNVFYNDTLFSSRKYNIKWIGKPDMIITTDKADKTKFPRKLEVKIVASDSLFIQNCPLDTRYRMSFRVTLIKDKKLIMSDLFTDKKSEIDEETWLEIKKLADEEPNADWRIIIEDGGAARQNYRGEWVYGGCGFITTLHYTLESFE